MDHLTQLQKNEFARSVSRRGFLLTDFRWEPEFRWEGMSGPCLRHLASGNFFAVAFLPEEALEYHKGHHAIYYKPGFELNWRQRFGLGWISVADEFSQWIDLIKREQDEGNLWETASLSARLLTPSPDESSNTPFSSAEQKRITASLDHFIEEVAQERLLTPEQFAALTAEVEHQKKAAAHLGRIDWRNAFAGALVGHIISSALTTENARSLLMLASKALHWLADTLPQLPSIGS